MIKIIVSVYLSVFVGCVYLSANSRPATKVFDGTATPLIDTYISYAFDDEMPGRVINTAREGTIAKGPLYKTDGSIVREGDVLVRLNSGRRKNILEQKKAALKIAESELTFAREEFKRAKLLINSKKRAIISKSTYDKDYTGYLKALADVESCKIGVARAQTWYDNTTIRANFDCIVTKVVFPFGLIYVGSEIIRIAQLSPMGVKIKMKREEAYKINNTTPVRVYPFGSQKPAGVYNYSKILTDDGIILRVKNAPLPPPVDTNSNGKKIPVINKCFCVDTYDEDGRKFLSVPVDSILEDQKGEYVWASRGENALTPDKGFNYIFPVKKVYIKTYDLLKNFSPHKAYKALKNTEDLKEGELVLSSSDLPKNLKDGDKVCFYQERYLFMPGDPVKVEIDSNPDL